MLKIFRTANWWAIITPQILGWIYFCDLIADHSFLIADWPRVLLFFLGVLSISAFGYAFNDYCDVDSDKLAGKRNALAAFGTPVRILLVLIPLLTGIIAWALVNAGIVTNILYALQVLALIVYSARPLRFKEKSLLGVATDAFYGHINPAFFTIGTFASWGAVTQEYTIVLLALILTCTTLKGLRNILLHQLDDRKKDRKAGVKTFVTQNGGLFTLYFINNLLPFEIIFTAALCLTISYQVPPFILSVLFFSVLTYLKFSGWKLSYLPKRQLKFKFLYFLNDYYEGWMPVFFLLVLSVRNSDFLILLAAHLVLFPSFVIKLWRDLQTIAQNFKTEDDY